MIIYSFTRYVLEMYNTFDDYTGPIVSPGKSSGIDIRGGSSGGYVGGDMSRFGDVCALPDKVTYKEEVPETRSRETRKRKKGKVRLSAAQKELYKKEIGI